MIINSCLTKTKYPNQLFRRVEKEEYALDFVMKGKFFLTDIVQYKSEETSDKIRKDDKEGVGSIKYDVPDLMKAHISKNPKIPTHWETGPGEMTSTYQGINGFFALCFSLFPIDKGHGDYLIDVEDPRKLTESIRDYLEASKYNSYINLMMAAPIRYDYGEKRDHPVDSLEGLDTSWEQKPQKYQDEKEWRIVAMTNFPGDEMGFKKIHVDIGDISNYVSYKKT